jgi:Pentapeptide repeats (8 copies)
MANADHLERLRQGVEGWNAWRTQEPLVEPDLSNAWMKLFGANLSKANLTKAILSKATLTEATLTEATLTKATLHEADLTEANLTRASIQRVSLVETKLKNAILTDCRIYGVSAWDVELEGVKQSNLVITPEGQPKITVDNIEMAQFVYLLLHNEKIREVIDTITSKAVLILGRFTPARKAVLDALRDELRRRDYLPILFDFDKPASQDLTATVSTLAHLARFIIADVTDPSSIPYELATVVPTTPVPIQPILLSGKSEFAMFVDLRRRYQWVLATHHYDTPKQLIANLASHPCICNHIRPPEGYRPRIVVTGSSGCPACTQSGRAMAPVAATQARLGGRSFLPRREAR